MTLFGFLRIPGHSLPALVGRFDAAQAELARVRQHAQDAVAHRTQAIAALADEIGALKVLFK